MSHPIHYDPDLGVFLRIFNVRYVYANMLFELPIKATCWDKAVQMLKAIKANGVVHNELIETIE